METDSGLQLPHVWLTAEDQPWLSSYGIDPSWHDNMPLRTQLDQVITLGSHKINRSDDDATRRQVIQAREYFLDFIGVEPATINLIRKTNPTLVPLDTLLAAYRTIQTNQLNITKIVRQYSAVVNMSAQTIQNTIDDLFKCGLDAPRIINANPSSLGHSIQYFTNRIHDLDDCGLDARKIINRLPGILGPSMQTIHNKLNNLNAHGLDSIAIVNANPSLLTYSMQTINERIRLLSRTVRLLQWHFAAQDLIKIHPNILNYSQKKIAILRRIAATYLKPAARDIEPKHLRSIIIVPLEQYLIALDAKPSKQPVAMTQLHSQAVHYRHLTLEERHQQAKLISARLGRIGAMYLDYAGLAVNSA